MQHKQYLREKTETFNCWPPFRAISDVGWPGGVVLPSVTAVISDIGSVEEEACVFRRRRRSPNNESS